MTNVLSFPSDDGKPRYSIVQVTPEMARRWLDRNIGNRNLRPRKVEKYARDMANGDWAIANDAICFTPDGVLSNGQHRLHAVIASGVTVTMVIGWNIPAESKSVMDTGGGRTPADAMGFHGWKNRVPLAASAKWLMLLRTGYDYEARHGYLNNGLTPAVWARVYGPNHPGALQRIPLDRIVLVSDQDTGELALTDLREAVPA